jgi:membrane associated rhomboid family serine protease
VIPRTERPSHEPIFNVPGGVLALLAVMVAVHLGRQLLSETADDDLLLALAFIPARYGGGAFSGPGNTVSTWLSPITHVFVHGDAIHLIVNGASMLAFGSVVERRMGVVRFLAFTIFSGVMGALLFALANLGEPSPMIGASGAIAGMMAAALRLIFSAIDTAPPGLAGEFVRQTPQNIALKPLGLALQDRRLQSATAVWLAINLLAIFGLGGLAPGASIAWEAHLGGYFAGLLCLGMFDRPPRQAVASA